MTAYFYCILSGYTFGRLPVGSVEHLCGNLQINGWMTLLNCLAEVRSVTSSLDEIVWIVKMNGYVASAEGINAQPQVVNGASLVLEVRGNFWRGR
jgi:hypothetical protein